MGGRSAGLHTSNTTKTVALANISSSHFLRRVARYLLACGVTQLALYLLSRKNKTEIRARGGEELKKKQ